MTNTITITLTATIHDLDNDTKHTQRFEVEVPQTSAAWGFNDAVRDAVQDLGFVFFEVYQGGEYITGSEE